LACTEWKNDFTHLSGTGNDYSSPALGRVTNPSEIGWMRLTAKNGSGGMPVAFAAEISS
jgi:hypothetical protein